MCDMADLTDYTEEAGLTAYVVRRAIGAPTREDIHLVTEALQDRDRFLLWSVLSQGRHMRTTLPSGTARVNPLVMAIQAEYLGDHVYDNRLPKAVQALLWACCSPNDFGAPKISPLGEAIRTGDGLALSLLLHHEANPERREEGYNGPIFLVIQERSAEFVQLFLEYRVCPRSREAIAAVWLQLVDRLNASSFPPTWN